MCNGADWKVAPELDLQCRLGVEVFGFKADNLYRALSLQSVNLGHEVWLWNGNCLSTTKIWDAPSQHAGWPICQDPSQQEAHTGAPIYK